MKSFSIRRNRGSCFRAGNAFLLLVLCTLGQLRGQSLPGQAAAIPVTTANAASGKPSTSQKKPVKTAAPPAKSVSPPKPLAQDESGLSIDDLLNVTVTSASQKEQKISDVAAAITVLNSTDILRSGATNIPDLLRYVPGVEVGQANNSDVSVTIRGFGGVYATKLLVLIDGRSIYDPIFGGVDWEFQRMMMEDIDRVEVIRGPGATVWGANAVNGVINIITKDASDTQEGYVSGIYGTKEAGLGTFRYGFEPCKGLDIRIFGQYENMEASEPLPNSPDFDQLRKGLIGFRADYRPDEEDHFRLSSDASSTTAGNAQFFRGLIAPDSPYDQTNDAENANFVWEHDFDVDNQLTVQSYYDRFVRNTEPTSQFADYVVQTGDIQIRHSLPIHLLPIKQELVYGIEYRQVDSDLTDTKFIAWTRNRNDQTLSGFAQTDLHLIENVLTLTFGTKYDHNDYTGNEIQPSGRLLWKIDSRNSVWGSISRAVREPDDINYQSTPPGYINGNTSLKSEVLTAYELGYRVQPMEELSFDISGFWNHYHDLISAFLPPGSEIPTFAQYQEAQTFGVEPSFVAQLRPWWKLSGSYSFLAFRTDNSGVSQSAGVISTPLANSDPENEFSLRSSFDLPDNVDIDLGGRYVDRVEGANGYFAVDVRVGWTPTPSWEFSIVGQNLLVGDHIENPNQFGNAAYVSPEVYGKVVFKF